MQFQAVSEQLDTIERWKADHDEAMECWAIESRLSMMLTILETLRCADKVILERVMSGKLSPEEPILVELSNVAGKFYHVCHSLLGQSKPFVEAGFSVKGYNVLLSICHEADGGLQIPAIVRDAHEMAITFQSR